MAQMIDETRVKDQVAEPVAGSSDPLEEAYRRSINLPIADVVKVLSEMLGNTLVMRLAGVKDPAAVACWAKGERAPRPASDEKLRTGFRVVQVLTRTDNAHAARAWMIGLNPQLGDVAPIIALAEGQLRDVVVAAEAFARSS